MFAVTDTADSLSAGSGGAEGDWTSLPALGVCVLMVRFIDRGEDLMDSPSGH